MQANLEALMKAELKRAEALYGATNRSDHESYAVLKEEIEEAFEHIDTIPKELQRFWIYVRQNASKLPPEYQKSRIDMVRGILYNIKSAALKAAEELIQVAAMCEKAINTMEDKGDAATDSD